MQLLITFLISALMRHPLLTALVLLIAVVAYVVTRRRNLLEGSHQVRPIGEDGAPAEVVAYTHIQREPGYLYFFRDSEVWRTPMKRAGDKSQGGAERVLRADFTLEEGYRYFLDDDGNVARTRNKRVLRGST